MPKKNWVEDVRGLLKREHGSGWGIEEQSGKVKFYRRVPGERKQAVTTNIPWAAGKQSEVIQVFATVRNRMEDLGICLAEAYQLSNRSPASNSAQMNWQEIAIQYEEYRIKTGLKQKTFNSEERYRIDRAILLINAAKNAPHDGKGLLKSYDHHYLSGLAPGSPGRKRNLLDVCRFLGFSVRSCGAPTKWLPPGAEEVSVLVGVREISPAPTVPVKPEQLLSLLESLTENPELRLAVGLVGLYGLRPAELMALTVQEERLYVAPVQRNRATAKQPKKDRLVLPLDLKELP